MNVQPEDIIPNIGTQKSGDVFNKIISENEKTIVIIGKSSNDMAIKASIPIIKSQPISIKINTGSGILQNLKYESKHTNDQTLDVIRIANTTKSANIQSSKLSCIYCGMIFIQQHLYNNHILVCPCIGKAKTYRCIYCHLVMDSKESFVNHTKCCPKRAARNKHILHGHQTNKTVKKLTNSKDIDTEESLSSEDEESENNISVIYDDDEDLIKDEYLDEDEDYEKGIFKIKTKHLGPILINGIFKCRDCSRTFSKDEQYKRHIKACTNAPLNASRIDLDFLPEDSKKCNNKTHSSNTLKRKRGRPRKHPLSEGAINISTEVENHDKIILNKNTDDDFLDIVRKNHIDNTWKNVENSENQHIIDKIPEKEFLSLEMEYKQLEKSPNSVRIKEVESQGFCEQSIEELLISSISTGESVCASNNNCQFSKNVENYNSLKSNCNVAMELYTNCALCNEKNLNKSEYADHLTKFHQEDVNNMHDLLSGHTSLDTFVCPLCHLFYVSTNLLLYHLVCVHTELLQSIYKEVLKSEKENGKTSCPWCNEISYTQQLHLEHLAIDHHKIFETKRNNNEDKTIQEIKKESITFKEYHNDSLHKENKNKKMDIRMVKAHTNNNNQEMICPDCGSYFKTLGFLNHHQKTGACERQVKKNFICTETECNGRSFYRLQNLFKHMKKVHGKTAKCRKMKFKTYSNFMDWLQSEELKHKVRYISTFRKPNKNHVSQTLVCHRFNTAHSDRRNEMKKETPQRQWCAKIPRSAHCFARLYTVTLRTPQNGRYEGLTQVTYYEDHNHSPVDQPPDIFERVMERHARNKKDQRKISISARTEGSAMSLHQNKKFKLNANDLIMENNKNDNLEMVIEDGVMDTGVLLEGDLQDEASYLLWPSDTIACERVENTTNETNKDGNDSSMVYVVQNGGFIVQDISEKDLKTKESEDMMQSSYVNLLDEHLIDRQDRLVSSLNSANSSNQQIIDSTNNDGNSLLFLDEKEFSAIGETTQCIASTDESFVIPADVSEWNKLFEVLSSQIESGALDVDKTVRGINLLAYQDSITEISLKEQVNIFNELCDITNVQVG